MQGAKGGGIALDHLPKELRDGLAAAQELAARKAGRRLRVQANGRSFAILRSWPGGFSLAAETTPQLRGLVDIHEGPRHLYRALIVASRLENRELVFEFKRATQVTATAPADFERPENPPTAMLPER